MDHIDRHAAARPRDRLSPGIDSLRPAADESGRLGRRAQDRLGQYRRDQRAAALGDKGLAAATLLFDMLKGTAAVLLVERLIGVPPDTPSCRRWRRGLARSSGISFPCGWASRRQGRRHLHRGAGGHRLADRARVLRLWLAGRRPDPLFLAVSAAGRGGNTARACSARRSARSAPVRRALAPAVLDASEPTSDGCWPARSLELVPRVAARSPCLHAPLPQAPLDDAQRLACLRLIRSEQVGPVTFRELINQFGGADVRARCAAGAGSARRRQADRFASARGMRPRPSLRRRRRPGRVRSSRSSPATQRRWPMSMRRRRCCTSKVGPSCWRDRQPPSSARAMPRPLGSALARQIAAALGGGRIGDRVRARPRHRCGRARGGARDGHVAVVAGGIDSSIRRSMTALQERIAVEGCLVTEQPPGFVPRAQDFPRRNRIISGCLSRAS